MTRSPAEQKNLDAALWLAVTNADEGQIRRFLAAGANPNFKTEGDRSAFSEAIQLTMFDMAMLMIEYGADLNYQAVPGVSPPLFVAAIIRDATKKTIVRTTFVARHGIDFSKKFTWNDQPGANVQYLLADLPQILTEPERAYLPQLRAIVDAQLATVTKLRQEKLHRHRAKQRPFKL